MLELERVKEILAKPLCDSRIHRNGRLRIDSPLLPDVFVCFSFTPKNEAVSLYGYSMPLNAFNYIPRDALRPQQNLYFDRLIDSPYVIHRANDFIFLGQIEGTNPPFNGEKFKNPYDNEKHTEKDISTAFEKLKTAESKLEQSGFTQELKIILKGEESSQNLEGFIPMDSLKVDEGGGNIIDYPVNEGFKRVVFYHKPFENDAPLLMGALGFMPFLTGMGDVLAFDTLFDAYKGLIFKEEDENE